MAHLPDARKFPILPKGMFTTNRGSRLEVGDGGLFQLLRNRVRRARFATSRAAMVASSIAVNLMLFFSLEVL